MFPYDEENFSPPAPSIGAEIRALLGDFPIQRVKMQLDSGSDMTCIPRNAVSRIRSLRYGCVDTVDFDRHESTCRTCFLRISFAGFDFKNLEAILIDGDLGLFGRDVLNNLNLSLDGPNLRWLAEMGTREDEQNANI